MKVGKILSAFLLSVIFMACSNDEQFDGLNMPSDASTKAQARTTTSETLYAEAKAVRVGAVQTRFINRSPFFNPASIDPNHRYSAEYYKVTATVTVPDGYKVEYVKNRMFGETRVLANGYNLGNNSVPVDLKEEYIEINTSGNTATFRTYNYVLQMDLTTGADMKRAPVSTMQHWIHSGMKAHVPYILVKK